MTEEQLYHHIYTILLFLIIARYELYNMTSQMPLWKNLCGY